MQEIVFVCGDGIGNVIQAIPTLELILRYYIVDIYVGKGCEPEVVEILKFPGVRDIFYMDESTKNRYLYQLNASQWRYRPKFNATKSITSRLSVEQYPESQVYYDIAIQMGIDDPLPYSKIACSLSNERNSIVAMFLGSKPNCGFKRWDKYDILASKFGKVVIFGKESDSNGENGWLIKKWNWGSNVSFFTGSLCETAYQLSKCNLFVGNDGGLAHLAASTGIPTFVLFGPTSIIKNKPNSPNTFVVSKKITCSPCQFKQQWKELNKTGTCEFKNKCLAELTVEDVMTEINHFLTKMHNAS